MFPLPLGPLERDIGLPRPQVQRAIGCNMSTTQFATNWQPFPRRGCQIRRRVAHIERAIDRRVTHRSCKADDIAVHFEWCRRARFQRFMSVTECDRFAVVMDQARRIFFLRLNRQAEVFAGYRKPRFTLVKPPLALSCSHTIGVRQPSRPLNSGQNSMP